MSSVTSKLGMGMDWRQVLERTELVRGMCGFQTTLAQLVSMCKGRCTCLPLRNLVVRFHKEGISVAVPLYVSFDPPVFKLSSSLRKVVVYRGWAQEDGLEPRWKRFNRFG